MTTSVLPRSNVEGSCLRCINDKIQADVIDRAQLDEVCLSVHSKLCNSLSFCARENEKSCFVLFVCVCSVSGCPRTRHDDRGDHDARPSVLYCRYLRLDISTIRASLLALSGTSVRCINARFTRSCSRLPTISSRLSLSQLSMNPFLRVCTTTTKQIQFHTISYVKKTA